MYKDVTIGSKTIGMLANGFSPYLYKICFREDFLKKVQEPNPDPDLFVKMGFIMAKQAEEKDISKLTRLDVDAFYKWVSSFDDPMDPLLATNEISTIYFKQAGASSVPKNEPG